MRSWVTLQPGERQSCVGCHERANDAPPFRAGAEAFGSHPVAKVELAPRGFSFPRDVQPILDRRCVRCHDGVKNPNIPDLTSSLVGDGRAKRRWTASYVALTHAKLNATGKGDWWDNLYIGDSEHPQLNWICSGSEPTLIPPLTRGSRTSGLFARLDAGHGKGITEAEMRILACWVDLGVPFGGDYVEGANWSEEDVARWNDCVGKRNRYATSGEPTPKCPPPPKSPAPGK